MQIELPKDASIGTNQPITQKAEAFLDKKPEITQIITTVGQASGDFGGTQATAYKSEINVKLVDRKEREDVSRYLCHQNQP